MSDRRPGAALLLAVLAGCHLGHDESAARMSFEMAEFNYQNAKYDQAKIMYDRTLEGCPDHLQAKVGLAHACREVGNLYYRMAADLMSQNQEAQARRQFNDANDNHALAFAVLQALLPLDEAQARYGLGLLHYQRATSMFDFPFPLSDKLTRQKERDKAIEHFRWVVQRVPQTYTAHRYLGLALFSAGRFDEGRSHLKIFHDAQQVLFEQVARRAALTEQARKDKERNLRAVERDIQDVREVLGEYFMSLQRERDRLDLKPDRTPEETQRLAKVNREALEMESYLKGFTLVSMGEDELKLRQRCQDLFDAINKGLVSEVLGFVAFAPSAEAQLRRDLDERIAKGLKFRKIQYRSIGIDGSNASIAVLCERATNEGVQSGLQFTLRWRLTGGQWKATEIP